MAARAMTRIWLKLSVYDIIPAYDYVQNIVENKLHEYIKVAHTDIRGICIVGGYLGKEIPRLLRRYSNARIVVYEPSERYAGLIASRFSAQPRVDVRRRAVSSTAGEATFFETNLKGSGSLLEVGPLAVKSYGAKQAERFTVPTVTLDDDLDLDLIDCLWIDVQGAELMVLEGAKGVLARTRSIFVEIAMLPDLYKDGATQAKLTAYLASHGFELAALGLDTVNLTGNAFFIRSPLGERG
ncbi:FkbM family methyltransferase [Mesorhizobium sp.]|uniref:FkbM family methyltransferase n=1 Tax=Mesorhizobium sp. TaxID=1871066 RepID=UPI00257C66C1|nr:FkbM family methyltransferase [Mesorhizobium sp.]